LEIHYEAGPPGQLYATFTFGKLEGIMRICPSSLLEHDPDTGIIQPVLLRNFEAACNLPEGFRPSPASDNKLWLMRWRGHDGDFLVSGETQAQGQFRFEENPENSTADLQSCNSAFDMIHRGKYFVFKGNKIEASQPQSPAGWSLAK